MNQVEIRKYTELFKRYLAQNYHETSNNRQRIRTNSFSSVNLCYSYLGKNDFDLQKTYKEAEKHYKENYEKNIRFGVLLTKFLNEKNMSDSYVYNKAGINKTTWHNNINDITEPKNRKNILKIAIAAELTVEQTNLLFKSIQADGISHSDKLETFVEFCLINGIYDTLDVDSILSEANLDLLFSE